MRIYLAGGASGNLTPYFRVLSRLLEKGDKLKEAKEKAMRVFSRGGVSALGS